MSKRQKGKNDTAWEALFERYDILSHISREGKYEISADQIREYREPRLMAKFDHQINLPNIFSEHGLSILPISRGDYVISHFQAYHAFETGCHQVRRMSLPAHLQSLGPGGISSEAIALNSALASGIFSDFLGEEILYPTVSGRMGSEDFCFSIWNTEEKRNVEVAVRSAQIEIDAALEGEGCLALVEAKLDISEDFLVRQLYYPFRAWKGRISKRVRPVFMVYSNGIFSLYEYVFQPEEEYHSLRLARQKNYAIEEAGIGREDFIRIFSRTVPCREPEVPFPQADSFKRVINLCELLSGQPMSREQVTQEYAFDIRQTNYYTDAGRYLGLVEKSYRKGRKPFYALTDAGRSLMRLPIRHRNLEFVRAVLKHKVFHDAAAYWLRTNELPDRGGIIRMMREAGLYHVDGESTYVRRASTVSGWLRWMTELVGE